MKSDFQKFLIVFTVITLLSIWMPGKFKYACAGDGEICTAAVTNISYKTARLNWTVTGSTSTTKYQAIVYDDSEYSSEIYDTGEVTSSDIYHDIPADTLACDTTHYWKIRVYGNWGGTGEAWSSYALSGDTEDDAFTTSADATAPSTPVITDDGASTSNNTSLHATWTSTDEESGIAEYQYAISTSATDPGSGYLTGGWISTGTTANVTTDCEDSALWTQTSQEDFETTGYSNDDTSTSDSGGSVVLSLEDTENFSYTGGVQTWEVPAGITSIIAVDATGAGGGTSNGAGGKGARVQRQTTLSVTSAETLYIYVGGVGGNRSGGTGGTGGWNGGGAGGSGNCGGGGGGGSDIRQGGTALTDRVVIAAGGGGGGGDYVGGNGGENGSDGDGYTESGGSDGKGGTQISGGACGYPYGGSSGSLGQGGYGQSVGTCGGGGGGGYYGGGGGGGSGGIAHGSGGGGSSYGGNTYTTGYQSGNGYINLLFYCSSGTFTSAIHDNTSAYYPLYSTISWNATTPDNTAISIKVRSCDDSECSGETAFSSCEPVANGEDISSNACVTDGDQYIQYEATLTTSDIDTTPSLDDITINYIDHPCLAIGTTYYFHVKAQNGCGNWSSVGNSDGILNMTSRKSKFWGDFKTKGYIKLK